MYFILGLGKTGLAVAKYFQKNSIPFLCSEDNQANIPENISHLCIRSSTELETQQITALILSPGISSKYNPTNQFVLYAKTKSIPIISDIHLFQSFFPEKKYIGITGTNGKSTTTTLVYEIFKNAGKNAALCGNIGTSPFANAVSADVCIMEISSFQLEITHQNFDISAIINITPDHIDRYTTLENYTKEKLSITDISRTTIINSDIKHHTHNTMTCSHTDVGADYTITNNEICFQLKPICTFPQTKLLGMHNMQNIMFAFAIAHQFGIEIPVITKTIEGFNAIEHRIEFAGKLNGTTFYNDSKATNVDSTLNALRAITLPTFLIVGGKLVEDITNLFANAAFSNVKMIAIIGSAAGTITKEIHKHNDKNPKQQIKYCISGNIEKAITDLYYHARQLQKSVILLSPFCKSFDQFKSFEERGKLFKNSVIQLINQTNDSDVK